MFSSIKMEEYIEPELSGIFLNKNGPRNIVVGPPWTHFMHMRVKESLPQQSKPYKAYYDSNVPLKDPKKDSKMP